MDRVLGATRRKSVKIALDVVLLVGFLAEFITREGPDYDLHSWIGVVLMPIIAIHLASNIGWIKRTLKNRSADREWPLARFNAVFGVLAAVCILTGFPIWFGWGEDPWSIIHTVTGFLSIILMFSHLWRNRSRILRLAGRS